MFRLSAVLGGRESVLDSPTTEIFAYLDMQHEKEEAAAKNERTKLWTEFLISIYSQPPQDGEKAEMKMQRQQFIDSLKPETKKKPLGWSNIPDSVLAAAEKLSLKGG